MDKARSYQNTPEHDYNEVYTSCTLLFLLGILLHIHVTRCWHSFRCQCFKFQFCTCHEYFTFCATNCIHFDHRWSHNITNTKDKYQQTNKVTNQTSCKKLIDNNIHIVSSYITTHEWWFMLTISKPVVYTAPCMMVHFLAPQDTEPRDNHPEVSTTKEGRGWGLDMRHSMCTPCQYPHSTHHWLFQKLLYHASGVNDVTWDKFS